MSRIAVVTGAGRGIGEATAQALARDGHIVALADLNVAEARRAAGALAGSGHEAFEVDVVEERSVEALFDTVEARLGPVAVLACVAGGPFLTFGRRPSIIETTTENWMRTEALNARGPFLCMRAMLRRRTQKSVPDGRIITVSSMSGITPESPTGPAYSAAKAAVIHLTRYAALEAAPLGITVNTVAPGLTDTPAVRADLTAEQIEMARRAIPIGRLGKPADRRNDRLSGLSARRLHHRRRDRSQWRSPATVRTAAYAHIFDAGASRAWRRPLENRHALGDLVEGLLVDDVDRHLRTLENTRIVKRADLQDDRRQTRPSRRQMGAAVGAELACHGILEVASGELLGPATHIVESRRPSA